MQTQRRHCRPCTLLLLQRATKGPHPSTALARRRIHLHTKDGQLRLCFNIWDSADTGHCLDPVPVACGERGHSHTLLFLSDGWHFPRPNKVSVQKLTHLKLKVTLALLMGKAQFWMNNPLYKEVCIAKEALCPTRVAGCYTLNGGHWVSTCLYVFRADEKQQWIKYSYANI